MKLIEMFPIIYIYIANFEIISTISFKNYLSERDLHDKKNF